MPLHTNHVEHEQYVLRGRARVVLGDEVVEVKKDDVVYIPGGLPHSYEALGDESFEFLCAVPNLQDEIRVLPVSGADEEVEGLVVPEELMGC
jgi:quercetin dioxygenase-like cupin family protein